MHEGELELTTATAARLIAQRFPELAGLPLQRVPTTGTVNTIVRIGDALVARFPLVGETEEALATESAAMSELADVCPVASPRPFGTSPATPEYPSAWSVQTWVPGDTAAHDDHVSSTALAGDITELISTLRSVDVRGRVFDGRGRGGILSDHDDWVSLCIERSGHLLNAARVRRLWDTLRTIGADEPAVMSHRDLTPFNLLVSDDRLVGVLDGGGFGPADRSLDLVAAWHLFDAPRRRIIRDGLGSRGVEWRRGAAWALQQAMGLIWYYEDSNPAMSALGRSTMRRLLDADELSSLG